MKEVVLLAASGLAREVIAAQLHETRIIGVLDDDPSLHGTKCAGVPVLGEIDLARELGAKYVLCMGSGRARQIVRERLSSLSEYRFVSVVDKSVRIPPGCSVGAGSILLAGTVLTASVTIGQHAVVMPNVTFTHDVVVGDFATIAAGVALGGSVRVGEAAYLGMNSSVRQGVPVGRDAVVGMGAVVLRPIPDGETWVGVPAHAMNGLNE